MDMKNFSGFYKKTVQERQEILSNEFDLTKEEENAIVYKEIKEAKETLETTPADRSEVIEKCHLQIAVWSEFAPERMSEDQIRQVVKDVLAELGIEAPTPKDKGKIMKPLMSKLQGKAEGGVVNQVVSEFMS
jgi:uncharacterized protein YqeY